MLTCFNHATYNRIVSCVQPCRIYGKPSCFAFPFGQLATAFSAPDAEPSISALCDLACHKRHNNWGTPLRETFVGSIRPYGPISGRICSTSSQWRSEAEEVRRPRRGQCLFHHPGLGKWHPCRGHHRGRRKPIDWRLHARYSKQQLPSSMQRRRPYTSSVQAFQFVWILVHSPCHCFLAPKVLLRALEALKCRRMSSSWLRACCVTSLRRWTYHWALQALILPSQLLEEVLSVLMPQLQYGYAHLHRTHLLIPWRHQHPCQLPISWSCILLQ